MSEKPAVLLVDAHVHFHECFTWKTFLDAAASNFESARRELGLPNESPGCLMFTESAGIHAFRALADQRLARSQGWNQNLGDDGVSITMQREDRAVIVIAGRQIVTAERLEVLALGCERDVSDGQPVREVLGEVNDAGAVAVIPWGCGKWFGARGKLLRALIENENAPKVCLGDNGGRPSSFRRPPLLAWAESHGVVVLAGSDPLPMRSQVDRAGSYGSILSGWRMTASPGRLVKARIAELQTSPRTFGKLSSLSATVRAQLELRWKRRHIWHARPTAAPF